MNVFKLVGQVSVEGVEKVEGELEKTTISAEKLRKGMLAVGAGMAAVGAAALKLSDSSRKLNSQISVTALSLGKTTGEMRELVLETSNVTFGLQSVITTFDLLTRAGLRSTEEIQKAAVAFDTLGDATFSNAETVANILIPAHKALGEEIPTEIEQMDRFTWLVRNTTINMEEFGSVMQYVAMYGANLGVTINEMIGILAALEARGISGSAATRLFRTAVSQAADGSVTLNEALGVSQDELDGYVAKLDGAKGMTQEFADAANTQYSLMDKLKHKWDELTLQMGSFLEPLEPIMATLTSIGMSMVALTTAGPKVISVMKALNKQNLINVATSIAKAAASIWAWASSIPFVGIALAIGGVAALGASVWGIYNKFKKMAYGGTIPEPTLLYGMRSKAIYGMAGEQGTEYVTPANRVAGGGVNVSVTGNQFIVRQDSDIDAISIKLADEIQRRTRSRGLG